MIYETGYLIHYGIKGQQWGVRRYQNEDGTLTKEGMQRYGISENNGRLQLTAKSQYDYNRWQNAGVGYKRDVEQEKKEKVTLSKRRVDLIDQYQRQGLTKNQAEIAAARREKTENALKVLGGITIAAALTYGAYKGRQWIAKNGNSVLKKGTDLFRVTGDNAPDLDKAGYVVGNTVDAEKYKGLYGMQILRNKMVRGNPGGVNQITGKASRNIKIAGDRTAKKVYNDLLKNDPEFIKANDVVKRKWTKLAGIKNSNSYEDFNTRLATHDSQEDSIVQKKFYDALKRKGFGGVVDVNDRDFSGYNTKKPIILFNMKDSITNQSIRSMTYPEIAESALNADRRIRKEILTKETLGTAMTKVKRAGIYTGVSAGLLGAATKHIESENQRQGAITRMVIKRYKDEHPNTKLSDDEIIENELVRKG